MNGHDTEAAELVELQTVGKGVDPLLPSRAVIQDEIVLARFGKKQQLRVSAWLFQWKSHLRKSDSGLTERLPIAICCWACMRLDVDMGIYRNVSLPFEFG